MKARKRFGQHFLEDTWGRKLVDLIAPAPGERLIEIGPGRGALTRRLLDRGARVTAVEIDRDLASTLQGEALGGLRVVAADVLRVDLPSVVTPDPGDAPPRVIGNLPYNISSRILVQLAAQARGGAALREAIVMLQREVADRAVAQPGTGDYGPLAITLQMHADVERMLELPPGAFRPPPKVHSTVVRLRFRAPRVTLSDARLFDSLVRRIFTRRRKTIRNSLQAFASSRGADAAAALERAALDPARRPETLSIEDLARLVNALAASGAVV